MKAVCRRHLTKLHDPFSMLAVENKLVLKLVVKARFTCQTNVLATPLACLKHTEQFFMWLHVF